MSLPLVQAQQIILVKRRKPGLKYVFNEGEALKLKLKESGKILKGAWHYEGENKITLDGQLVPLQDICWISIRTKEKGIWVLRKGQDMLVLTGMGIIAVLQANRIISPDNYTGNKIAYKNSAALVTSGLICRSLDRTIRKRKVPIGKRFGIYLMVNP
jgi:hypothetical protein